MTIAAARAVSAAPSRRPEVPPAVITVLVVAHRVDVALPVSLDAVLDQTHHPDHVTVIDTSGDGSVGTFIREEPRWGPDGADVAVVSHPGTDPRAAVTRVVSSGQVPEDTTHLWLVTSYTCPDPDALRRLSAAVRSSPSVGVAGPKQVRWTDPSRLHRFGLQATRSGRLVLSPGSGEPDQGQFDHRVDALAVPFEGLFAERTVLESLHGFESLHGDLGGDIDFGWRTHQSGQRVVLVPGAVVRVGVAGSGAPTVAQRREVRGVAVTRCSWWAAPVLAAWVLVSGVVAAVALLVLKRPRAAWSHLTDLGGVLAPWRVLSARWRSRGTRTVARRDLRGLFVPAGVVARSALDFVQEPATPEEVGAEEEPEPPARPGDTRSGHVLRHPAVLVVLAALAMTLAAGRSIPGALLERTNSGLVGGELIGVRADATTLWHTWWDGWHGAGLGTDAPTSPAVAVLALLSWLFEHVPLVDNTGSPAGAALAWFLLLALPVASLTAYLSARVLTRTRWARALAALVWVSTAVASSSVADGRVGALVALILLPPVVAGLVSLARRSGTATTAFATALAATVLGAFVPGLLALVILAALAVLLGGSPGARARALVLLVVPPVLLGPWIVTLVTEPRHLLAGAGTTVWGGVAAEPWQIALAHPGGAGSYAVYASIPLVALGVLGLVRTRAGAALPNAVAVTVLAGLVLALVAPHVTLGEIPAGLPGAGDAVTMWSGIGLLPYVLGLLAGALLGVDRLHLRHVGRWRAALRWPLVAAAVAGALGAPGLVAWQTFGTTLSAWSDPRPAVAVDQAGAPLANRTLFLDPSGQEVGYRLVGREADSPVRGLPPADPSADPALDAAVGALVTGDDGSSPAGPADVLVTRAVGFIQLPQDAPRDIVRRLDAAEGLARLGPHAGTDVWRVEPPASGGSTARAVAPSRLSAVATRRASTVVTTGQHAATDTTTEVVKGSRLSVAEPPGWTSYGTVRVDGEVVAADTTSGVPTYDLPRGNHQVEVNVRGAHPWWQEAQVVLLVLVAFLAIPFGRRVARGAA